MVRNRKRIRNRKYGVDRHSPTPPIQKNSGQIILVLRNWHSTFRANVRSWYFVRKIFRANDFWPSLASNTPTVERTPKSTKIWTLSKILGVCYTKVSTYPSMQKICNIRILQKAALFQSTGSTLVNSQYGTGLQPNRWYIQQKLDLQLIKCRLVSK